MSIRLLHPDSPEGFSGQGKSRSSHFLRGAFTASRFRTAAAQSPATACGSCTDCSLSVPFPPIMAGSQGISPAAEKSSPAARSANVLLLAGPVTSSGGFPLLTLTLISGASFSWSGVVVANPGTITSRGSKTLMKVKSRARLPSPSLLPLQAEACGIEPWPAEVLVRLPFRETSRLDGDGVHEPWHVKFHGLSHPVIVNDVLDSDRQVLWDPTGDIRGCPGISGIRKAA